jgi:hypothetical protein
MPAAKILELRRELESRFRSTPVSTPVLTTGLAPLDKALGGGLLQGAITQLISPLPTSGTAFLVQQFILAMQSTSQLVGLIDGSNSFDPFGCLPSLLWVRCQNTSQALKATDLLLRDGNLPLVIFDLKHNADSRRIPGPTWYRFQRLAEENRIALMVVDQQPSVVNSARTIWLKNSLSFADLSSSSEEIFSHLEIEVSTRHLVTDYEYACA